MRGILQDSLYYPAGGIDGEPILWANTHGYASTFVYADSGISVEEVFDAVSRIKPYEPQQPILKFHFPGIVRMSYEMMMKYQSIHHLVKEPMQDGFAYSFLLKRKRGYESAGHPEIRILYLRSDATTAYYYLYYKHRTHPKYVCITNTPFVDDSCDLHQLIMSNPYGVPEYLIHEDFRYSNSDSSPWSSHNTLHKTYHDKENPGVGPKIKSYSPVILRKQDYFEHETPSLKHHFTIKMSI